MITTLILAAITASEVWGTWKALKKPSSPGMLIASAIISIVIIAFIGNAVPWYREVNYRMVVRSRNRLFPTHGRRRLAYLHRSQ